MPGHVKAGGSKEADPDPNPFLLVSFEMKKEDSLKPYDAKKSVWVPDGEGGFDEAMIDEIDGEKVSVKVGWEPKVFKTSQIMQVNPPKMEKFDDVSNMTYLNEASVLWNLKARYVAKLIYVSKSMSLVVKYLISIILDVFWAFLCGDKSVQALPHLYQPCSPDVYWEEKE